MQKEITANDTAELVKRQRAETGLSMREFAKSIGVAYGTINQLKHAQTTPTTDTMARLAAYAGKCGATHFAELWCVFLNSDWLGSVFVQADLIRQQTRLIQGQIRQAIMLLEAGSRAPALTLLNHAAERAEQTLKDAASVVPNLPQVERRAGSNAYQN